MPNITLNRSEHKAFIDGLASSKGTLYGADNKARIDAYVPGFLYGIEVDTVDSHTYRMRGTRIEAVVVTYTER